MVDVECVRTARRWCALLMLGAAVSSAVLGCSGAIAGSSATDGGDNDALAAQDAGNSEVDAPADGAAGDGPTGDAGADDGSAVDGPAIDGSSIDGSATDGSVIDASSNDGSAADASIDAATVCPPTEA